ncbi:trypsin-like serine peptidase [Agromyces aerolatus]|uniref:trypsin-like serine peptidase n=1 Tax=Agromyces sp. LY-1074 TaxID=3074080 RepID=UPI00285BD05F|nr:MULTISPECIES: trypsin-like peptidase domain-containing protein [unclassified Agromyces]MDR5699374.1 trypsin-like peptidase domain-containing protein [Agromyces sp. LY-1074]MDR5705670.1 trypsin-like peptidase domain-containing protein [Agromyces sp. LY-1358]
MKLTPLRAGLVGAALVACGLLVTPVAAGAAPAADPGVDTVDVSATEAAEATDYWTPERMRTAIPADSLVVDAGVAMLSTEVETGAPVTYAGVDAGVDAGASSERPTAAPGVGKVFFVKGDRRYVCSGNSVGSGNGSVVATAGHCVHGGGYGESFVSQWVFVPAYHEGAAPYGIWSATGFSVSEQWSVNKDYSYDTGFVRVGKVDDRTLAQAAGASPIAFNQARGLDYTAFGYPAAPPFDGQTVKSCTGTATPDPYYETQSQGIPCDMTPGSSGGPWFLASGAQNSVNSYGYSTVADRMFGPYFGSVAQSAYVTAAS